MLEVQDMIMSFLMAFCNRILHDIPADTLLADAYPVKPGPILKEEEEANGFDSMAVMALEAPYRVPARLDFVRIEALLRAKMASADDHVRQLREDPGYFLEQLHETMEQHREMLKDTNCQAHPARSLRFQNLFWTDILAGLVASAYFAIVVVLYISFCGRSNSV